MISNLSADARRAPARVAIFPAGLLAVTWIANARSTPLSTPSSIMYLAPWNPSSPGWNMKRILPVKLSLFSDSRRAALASMATWVSWPQACIFPAFADLKSDGKSSCSGRASMSPRRSTVGPGLPESRSATTDVVDSPSVMSRPSPVRASVIRFCVRGRSSPSSGS